MEYILKTNDLVKRYGRYEAFNLLTLNLPKGTN